MWYEAVWLKLNAEPGKRIVICQPLVETENAAWAILRSAKHDETPGFLLAGDKASLMALNQSLAQGEASWGDVDQKKLEDSVKTIADKLKVKILAKQNVTKAEVFVFKKKDPLVVTQDLSRTIEIVRDPKKIAENAVALEAQLNVPTRDEILKYADLLHAMEQASVFVGAQQLERKITAAAKNPKSGYYPRFITEQAKETWDYVNEKYRKTIMGVEERPTDPPGTNIINKRWAVAIIIFRRACVKNGVLPFQVPDKGGGGTRGKMADEIRDKVHSGNVKADTEIYRIGKALQKEELATKMTNEMFYETAKKNSRYYITTFRKIRLAKQVMAKDVLKDLIGEHGYNGSAAGTTPYAHKKLDSVTDILWELDPDIGEKSRFIYAYTTCWMSKDQAIILLDLPDNIPDNKLLKMLKVAGRNWVKGGQAKHLSITQLVEGAAHYEPPAILWETNGAEDTMATLKDKQKVVSSLVAKGHKDLAGKLATALMPHQKPVGDTKKSMPHQKPTGDAYSPSMPHQPAKASPGGSMPHQKPKNEGKATEQSYTSILKDDKDGVIKTFLGLK